MEPTDPTCRTTLIFLFSHARFPSQPATSSVTCVVACVLHNGRMRLGFRTQTHAAYHGADGRLVNCLCRIQQLLISISFPTASHLQHLILKHFFTLRVQKLLLNCRFFYLVSVGWRERRISKSPTRWWILILSPFTVCSGVENLKWGRMGRAMSQELKLETVQWCHRLRHVEGAMSNSSLMNASASTCLPAQVTSPPDYQRVHSRGGDERSGRLHREESGNLGNLACVSEGFKPETLSRSSQ